MSPFFESRLPGFSTPANFGKSPNSSQLDECLAEIEARGLFTP